MEKEKTELKVIIEHNNTRIEFKGDFHDVWNSINKYFSTIFPSFEAIKKIVRKIDVNELSEMISDEVKIINGKIIVHGENDAKRKIVLALAGAYIGATMGLIQNDFLTPQQISEATGIDSKIVRARLSEMVKSNLVFKIDEGKYKYSPIGEKLIKMKKVKGVVKE
ncbi:MAG: hypothetical protein QXF09_02370 [Nitrososphaerota archaeon]